MSAVPDSSRPPPTSLRVQFGTCVPGLGHDTLHVVAGPPLVNRAQRLHRAAVVTAASSGGPLLALAVHVLRLWSDAVRRSHTVIGLLNAPLDDLLVLPLGARCVLACFAVALLGTANAVAERLKSESSGPLVAIVQGALTAVVALPLHLVMQALARW